MNIFLLIKENNYNELLNLNLKDSISKLNILKQTPLILACELNISNNIIELLINYSKEVINYKDHFGNTALFYAEQNNNIYIIEKIKKLIIN